MEVMKIRSVLIIDDSKLIRDSLRKILEDGGYDVIGEADNGEKGVKLFSDLRPDIVTSDITMPVMNGLETLQEILKIDEDAKVIMVSAISEKRMVKDAIIFGAMNYITKPIRAENVLKVCEEVLNEV